MLPCMRTTVEIADDLLRRAKTKAAEIGVPLREIVESALRDYLSDKPKDSAYKFHWTTEKGKLLPGADLDDRNSLFDVMDGLDD
jgi:hypothetical protein